MSKPRFAFIVGTRPDAIKTAPVIKEFKKFSNDCEVTVISTGQHKEMLHQALGAFGLSADLDLQIMQHGQTLAQITSRSVEALDEAIQKTEPDLIFGQGDTSATFVASLCAFYRQIPFAHIEAGLRTETIWNPFPEEFNRRAVALSAQYHFAPTAKAKSNLRKEGIGDAEIWITGNTGTDAVMQIAQNSLQGSHSQERVVLLTTHRRENWGEPMSRIARAARRLADRFPDLRVVVPMHKNPDVRETLNVHLANHDRIDLIEPPDFVEFVQLMKGSYLILTDSGGIQEEAPTLGKPVLVLRDTTERPEGVEAGVARLIGTEEDEIFSRASRLLTDESAYNAMAQAQSPYGDGNASARIRSVIFNRFNLPSEEVPMWAS